MNAPCWNYVSAPCLMLAVLTCACTPTPSPASVSNATVTGSQPLMQRVAGCYRLRAGAWEVDSLINRFYATAGIPRDLQLDTARFTGWGASQSDSLPQFALKAGPPPDPRSHRPFRFWQRQWGAEDSIYIGEPLPMGGARLVLGERGEGLAGVLTTFTDAIPADGRTSATVSIVLDRVTCGP